MLRGRVIVLEPLTETHAAALAACADREQFRYFLHWPASWDEAGMAGFIRVLLGTPHTRAYAMRLVQTGEVIGSSSFMDIREKHRGLEIGSTWIAPAHRGTAVNPEAKFLMLREAFDRMGMIRVQLKCDARNAHSRRAIAKLGAVFEGILRRHMICPDGHCRDTAMFSITDQEWPAVRASLAARLGYVP